MQPLPPTRSESLWLEDGSIVLQAEGKQFKVYRGLLALQSTVFEDMFAFPQPPSGEELVEGCSIVHLSDSAVDVEFVLEEIFLRRWLAPAGGPIPIAAIAAFLRLGNKYDIQTLHREAIRRLAIEYPTNLAGFDQILHGCQRCNDVMKYEQWSHVDVANLAREQNLLALLPIALFWICRLWHADALPVATKGQKRADKTISALSPINERACLQAYHILVNLKERNTYSWVFSPPSAYPGCTTPILGAAAGITQCRIAREELLRSLLFPAAVIGCILKWEDEWEEGMCAHCIAVAEQRHGEGRQQSWDALPGVFGLPGWEELIKDLAVAV
ncbi:hypothetical protein FIBSPDRAFT_786044 [Athelia psychrophila]|uniref:BTB domain-containing protein n=1 Tax=Athelia psychrophila TaxID=1759441 RepID=A0A166M133_9AGAM|nr:hypothetical protein FIBSPDRAFT_786044 [Fibularhizoctonia sp. CBS 109695]